MTLSRTAIRPQRVNHGRIKERYRPTPFATEKRHHMRVMELDCMACGNGHGVIAHHLLSDAPGKRFRRDHELVLPLCAPCHADLHDNAGGEWAWAMARGFDPVREAVRLREESRALGIWPEMPNRDG